MKKLIFALCVALAPATLAIASSGAEGHEIANLTGSFFGILSVIIFVSAYSLVHF